jgi:hypothetical protein
MNDEIIKQDRLDNGLTVTTLFSLESYGNWHYHTSVSGDDVRPVYDETFSMSIDDALTDHRILKTRWRDGYRVLELKDSTEIFRHPNGTIWLAIPEKYGHICGVAHIKLDSTVKPNNLFREAR